MFYKLRILLFCFLCKILNAEESAECYDYIIVGSGSGGSVVANRLSRDPQISVLLLEAGERPPLVSEVPGFPLAITLLPNYMWNLPSVRNPEMTGLKDERFRFLASKSLGGTSNMNYNLYVRGNKRDYDDWAANGAVGWEWDNVFPYFFNLEDNRNPEIVSNGYHGTGGEVIVQFPSFHSNLAEAYVDAAKVINRTRGDFNGPDPMVFMEPQGTVNNGIRWSSRKIFIDTVVGRRNLKIKTSAFVTKIIFDGEKVACGVKYDHENQHKSVCARKEVIISAGTFNSPKLLMLSGIGPKDHLKELGIKVIADLPVGENLQEHLSTTGLVFEVNNDTFTFRADRITKDDYDLFVLTGTGPLTTLGGVETIGFTCSEKNIDSNCPDLEIIWVTLSVASDKGQFLRYATSTSDELWESFATLIDKDTIACVPYPTHPKSRGYLKLKTINPYDEPIIDFKFYSNSSDLVLMIEGLKMCLAMAESEPMKKFGTKPVVLKIPGCEQYTDFSEDHLTCIAKKYPFPVFHYCGSNKMGSANDPTTVVTPDLKVKGVKGLRVVDASIIPSLMSGHLHNPTTMIAEKASEMIIGDYKK